ncbi:uncharacterized protein LAJ45_04894 [Morchella importuna]|uniref:MFS general substrate transporter n=1 Tax=Morchella conica CCBAS932 TaxID=1392247 RepID=A0A3N4KBX5_9PEZI|nr:uncharacterized protein LAJ45_04894 [Morchella importuna]KAH8151192.1 hypothetical protein LAJ45_04894 [Morchella importuna]RPB08034.1 MFS general substrate transporter [Morchella conica CCBAS932]
MSDFKGWPGNETVFIVPIVITAVSFVAVVLRFVSRTLVRRRITVDDWLILSAWILALGLTASLAIGTKYGLGNKEPLVEVSMNKHNLEARGKARFALVVLYNPTYMATKISILFFYLSLFKNFKPLKWGAWITMGVVGIGGLIMTMLILFQCHPISAAFTIDYDPLLESHCRNVITIFYASAPLNIITDLAILLLPMPVLTSLNLPRKEKIVVVCLFAGGGFVVIIGVVRIYFLDKAVLSGNFDSDVSLSFMWSAIEVNVGIMCSSIPMLKPLVVILIPSFSSIHEIGYNSQPRGIPTFHGVSGTHELTLRGTASNESAMQDHSTFGANISHNTASSRICGNTTELFSPISEARMNPVEASVRQVYKPLILVTILFFFWGFSYGLIGVLRSKFTVLYDFSLGQSLVLEGLYFAPYAFTPRFLSGPLLKKYGFKATFITGLLTYTAGCLVFWPAGTLGTFPGFIVAAIILGVGIATIETAANPYVILVGPQGMGESRICFAQGFQAVGTICASLLEYYPAFSKIGSNDEGVADMNWVFLAIILFMVSLAVVFYYFPLPEISDDECPSLPICDDPRFWRTEFALGPILAVLTIFFYVGAQEMFNVFWEEYFASVGIGNLRVEMNWEMLGFGLFAVGRFAGSLALLWLCPRVVLSCTLVGCVVTAALAITRTGKAAATMMVLNRFFQASIFPIVFGMGLRGLGRHSKTVSIYLVTAICGGPALLNVYYAVSKARGYSFGMLVPTILFGLCLALPIYSYLSPNQFQRFGAVIRGNTSGALDDVPPMAKDVIQYVRKGLGAKQLKAVEHIEHLTV